MIQALPLEEDQAWARFRRLLDARHYEEAEDTCRQALEATPGDFRWRLGLSLALLGARKNELALRLAMTLVTDRPDHPESYRTLALAWLGLGKRELALEWANLARQRSPTPEYDRFVERLRRNSGVESPERAALGETLPLPAEEPDDFRDKTQIVDLATMKAAVAAPPHKRENELVTQIFQRDLGSAKSSLPPQAALEAQIHRLFGASLFGVWDTSTREMLVPAPHLLRKKKDRRRLFLGLAAAVSLAFAGALLVRTGVTAQSRKVVHTEVDALSKLIESGALPQAAELLPKVEVLLAKAGQAEQNHATVLKAEAVLYRHHDALPERRRRVEDGLQAGVFPEAERPFIEALLQPRADRAQHRDELVKLHELHPKDPEVTFLLATAVDASQEPEAAAQLYQEANDLDPAHLPRAAFRVEQAFRRGAKEDILRMVEMMRDVHPLSPWTQLAVRMLPPEDGAAGDETSTKSAANPIATPPVVEAEQLLLTARKQLANHGLDAAKAPLEAAAAVVHGEAPFLLDFAARLSDGAPPLAAHLMTLPSWPKDHPLNEALRARTVAPVAAAPNEVIQADPEPDRRPAPPATKATKRKRAKRRGR